MKYLKNLYAKIQKEFEDTKLFFLDIAMIFVYIYNYIQSLYIRIFFYIVESTEYIKKYIKDIKDKYMK